MMMLLFFLLIAATITTRAVKVRDCHGAVRHVHLSVGVDPSTSMIVSFASLYSFNTEQIPVGTVHIGTSPWSLDRVVHETDPPSHYNLTPLHGTANHQDGRYYSPYYHHLTINDLQPDTTYYYRVGITNNNDSTTDDDLQQQHETALQHQDLEQSQHDNSRQRRLINWPPYDGSNRDCASPHKIHSFTTAPLTNPDTPVTFAIVGDMGQFPHSEQVLQRMQRDREHLHLVVLAGDVAYTNEDHRRWDTFFDFLDDYPLFDHVPLQICPGNHDIDKVPDGTELFLGYEHRFRMPRVKPPELGLFDGEPGPLNMDAPPYPLPYEWGNSYYTYNYGPAKFVMLNAYASLEPNSTQYNWMVDEFESTDRTQTPWIITVLHPPIYNTFSLHHHDLQMVAAKEHLEPLLIQYKVNLVFTGHIHAYLRTANVAHEELVHHGPIHITVGAGGRKCEAPFQNAEPEPWVQVRDATSYGYGTLRILNRTTALWDWVHTGHTDKGRTGNQVKHSNETLPPGPSRDNVVIANQYFLQ